MDIRETHHTEVADNAVLLDVREPDEWARGHAPDAVLIPLGELPTRLNEVPQGSPLVVTCRSGGRSARAVAFLNANGIDAVNLSGGMLEWHRSGRPMTHDGPGCPEVH
ncbi:rhodanese-like domain-containing protein [Agilicoccus flavus]|uniref:rhodanese-like domain-containing protein n=1 Tax=Agilicoccus flavus TaxID=2775968 RepID=UPI001CF64BF2|nr:rhodanese-like domain-containing protein [Agilicoccus flavus]